MPQRTGQMTVNGWEKDGEKMFNMAIQNPCPISQRLNALNIYKLRTWNYYLIYTPLHVIQVIFADLTVACSNTVVIFEKDNIEKSLMVFEDKECSTLEKDKFTTTASVKGSTLKMEVDKQLKGGLNFNMKASETMKSKSKFNLDFNFNAANSESQLWVTPLSNDLTEYFASTKRLAQAIEGPYQVGGKDFVCG